MGGRHVDHSERTYRSHRCERGTAGERCPESIELTKIDHLWRIIIKTGRTMWRQKKVRRSVPFYDEKVMFSDQPVALILAEEWEIARFAATLVRIEYAAEIHATDLLAERDKAYIVKKPEKPRGDAATAYAAADVQTRGRIFYSNRASQSDGAVRLHRHSRRRTESSPSTTRRRAAECAAVFVQSIKIKPENIRVMSPFMGGGFGAGLRPQYQVVLAVLGALALERPVRLVLTRQQMYGLGTGPPRSNNSQSAPAKTAQSNRSHTRPLRLPRDLRSFRETTRDGPISYINAPIRNSCTSSPDWTFPLRPTCAHLVRPRAFMRLMPRWTSLPSRSSSIL